MLHFRKQQKGKSVKSWKNGLLANWLLLLDNIPTADFRQLGFGEKASFR